MVRGVLFGLSMRALLFLFVLSLLFSCGDASPEPPPPFTLAPDHIRVPVAISEDARVEADRIRVPRSRSSEIANVTIGAVITGMPSVTHPEWNPHGFLRRVKAIENGEDEIVILTEGATLTDVYKEGSFDAVLVGEVPANEDDGGELVTQSLKPLANGEAKTTFIHQFTPRTIVNLADEAKDGVVREGKLTLENGYVKISPYIRISGTFSIPNVVETFTTRFGLDYEGELTLSVESKGGVQAPIHLRGVDIEKELMPSRVIARGAVPIGGIPVPFSVRARVDAVCTWTTAAASKVTVTGRVSGKPNITLRYKADAGWGYTSRPLDVNLSGNGKVDLEGSLEFKCGIEPRLGVYIFDAAGPFASGSPYLALEGKTGTECPPPGVELALTPGFEAKFGAEANFLGRGQLAARYFKLDRKGTPWIRKGAKCGGGSEKEEPCEGRADNYFCGAEIKGDPGYVYHCIDGKTAYRATCPNECVRKPSDIVCH